MKFRWPRFAVSPIEPLDVTAVMARQRRELLRGEKRTVERLLRDYRSVEVAIERRLSDLVKEVEAAQRAGTKVGPAWLAKRERYQRLLDDVEARVGEYSRKAGLLTVSRRRETVAAGVEDASELVRELGVRTGLNGVPTRAFEAMVSQFDDGSPVLGLFEETPGETVAEVRRMFAEGVALGENPRKIGSRLYRRLSVEKTPRELAKKVQSAVRRMTRDRAVLIARDGAMRAYTSGQSALYAENADVVTGAVVVSALDSRTCYLCVGQHGRFVQHGEKIHRHPGCRCALRPIVLGSSVQGVVSGEAWLRAQPEAVQRAKLGRGRYELFQRGVPLRSMYAETDHPKWGPGLRALRLDQLPSRVAPSGQLGLPGVPAALYPREFDRLELPADVFLRDGSRLRPGADRVSQDLFSGDAAVKFGEGAEGEVRSLFPGLDARLVCQELVGAPAGSDVLVRLNNRDELVFEVTDWRFESCRRRLGQGPLGDLWMANDEFVLDDSHRGQGTGLRVFARQVAACKALGVGRIGVVAARTPYYPDGYLVWALFGYHGVLDPHLATEASAAFPAFAPVVAVEQLVRIPGGLEWWRRHGETWYGVFDVGGESFLTVVDRASDKRVRFDRRGDPLVADASQVELHESMVESFLARAGEAPEAYTAEACLARAALSAHVVESLAAGPP